AQAFTSSTGRLSEPSNIFLNPSSDSRGTLRTSAIRARYRSTSAAPRFVLMAKTTRCDASVICDWFQLAVFSFAFKSGSVTTKNFHGCRPKDEGAWTSACSSDRQSSAAIFRVGLNFLVAYLHRSWRRTTSSGTGFKLMHSFLWAEKNAEESGAVAGPSCRAGWTLDATFGEPS